jgi:hypothetical protein
VSNLIWFAVRLAFTVGVGIGVAWFIDVLGGPAWVKGAAALPVAVAFFVIWGAYANEFRRADEVVADAQRASEALDPLRDVSGDDTALLPVPGVFENVPALLASRAVERRDDVLAKWRYRGTRRTGVRR